ncbi:MAG: transcriptional activator NhaR [Labilithrix sp.]|nr:transcriptional activator NhaR [Labilithrix sp.]
MQRLNYSHLLYFWCVAREGGLAPASKALRLTPQTLSGQIRAFESSLGKRLFTKSGRKLVLTDAGRVAFRYADEIFALGQELGAALERGTAAAEAVRLDVGLVEALPKMIVERLLEPVLSLTPPVRLSCREGKLQELVGALGAHTLDVVLGDEPLAPGGAVRAFTHLLGECGVTFFASAELASRHRKFPGALDGAPLLVPAPGTALRRQLDAFFERHRVAPHIVGEFEDSALLKAFGAAGHGIFCVPSTVAREVGAMYDVRAIASTDEVVERFYAFSVERKIKNPAVATISQAARGKLFT